MIGVIIVAGVFTAVTQATLSSGKNTKVINDADSSSHQQNYKETHQKQSDDRKGDDRRAPPLPLCPPKKKHVIRNNGSGSANILLVSTLDGKLTALDPKRRGSHQVLWSVSTEPGSMLSSTLSQLDLNPKGGKNPWIKLIPSLGGGLYKFDGEVVEPVPFDAEALLRSSFKFSDGTVMTGGKEAKTYGIEVSNGNIRYTCGMDGCFQINNPQSSGNMKKGTGVNKKPLDSKVRDDM